MKSFNIEYKNLPLFEKNLIKSNFYNIALDKTVFREVTIFKVGKTAADYAKNNIKQLLDKIKRQVHVWIGNQNRLFYDTII